MSELDAFDPTPILAALVDGGVRFVLIGGVAAQVHGSPSLTRDIDICYARDPDNLRLIAEVLRRLVAIRRGMPAGVTSPIDERALRAGDVFTLTTLAGDLDLLGAPDPSLDYETLMRAAIPVEFAAGRVMVAGLDDLIAMKRAAGRPKDRIELEVLGALREEIDRRG